MDRYTPHHYKATSPYASTSQVTLETMPRPEELPLARAGGGSWGSPRLKPTISPSPQSSQDLRYHQSHRHISLPPTVEGHVELNPLLLARHESLIRYSMASPPTTASAFGDNPAGCWRPQRGRI
ncbi:hypothetical protein BD779DRAFT_1676423 [Infundibulicybe gibba]|nr:hypothetical protein BD779DRAFT_1676423 [Infundibulicybe gibba]